MNWQDQKKRIRRYLRDPDGNIWSDSLLKRLFNDSQIELANEIGTIRSVEIIRVPALFQMSYTYDWEWRYADHSGYNYKALRSYDQAGMIVTYIWEAEQIAGTDVDTADNGDHYTIPWEAWHCDTIGTPPPLWMPSKFKDMVYCAFDKEPLEPTTKKRVMDDRTWHSRKGKPQNYYRDDTQENLIYIYPIPDSVSWYDTSSDGMVMFSSDDDEVSDEYGTIVDGTGVIDTQNHGIPTDYLSDDENLLVIIDKIPNDIETDTDESDFAPYLRKYIEYGTLEKAYAVNNDGQIQSLQEYWAYRRTLALEVIRRFKHNRLADREFCLRTKGAISKRNRKRPRLPDAYPDIW